MPATHLFVDFSKTFDSVHREMTEKILLAFGTPKEIVTAIIILYRTPNQWSYPQLETHNFSIF